MPIRVECDCGHEMNVKDSFAGRGIRCRECQKPIRVPEFDEHESSVDPWDHPAPAARGKQRRKPVKKKTKRRMREMPQEVDGVFRIVKAICLLYGLIFVLFLVGGLFTAFGESGPDGPPKWFGFLMIPLGIVGAVASDSVRRRKLWALKFVKVFSAVYLLAFPIGTILGWYVLTKSGRIEKYFE